MDYSLALPMLPADHFLPLAQAAEAAGFTSIAVPESVFFPEDVSADYPYTTDGGRFWTPETPFLDPFVAIPAMAAVTERVKFFTNVLKLGIREPLLVAKTVSSAAALADGRVGLGIGLSWIPEEFEWLHMDKSTRGKRTDEAIAAIRAVMTGEMVEYHGKHVEFGRLMVRPVPQNPVPIYVGGLSGPGLKRAARLGDGWVSVANTLDEVAGVIPQLADLREEFGTLHSTPSGGPFEVKALCTDAFDETGFGRMAEMGVTEAMVVPWFYRPGDTEALEHQVESVTWFGDTYVAN